MNILSRLFGKKSESGAKEPVAEHPDVLRAMSQMQTRWKIGDRIEGRYTIYDIKAGGMGIVYIVIDKKSGIPFAVKTFQDWCFGEPGAVERFIREAEVWVELEKHPNIVRAHWVRTIEGCPYIFLDYVAGSDLRQKLFGGALPVREVLEYGIEFCRGMAHAEARIPEFAHRDIKPENCMLTHDDTLQVTDFGLAKTAAGVDAVSATRSDLDQREAHSQVFVTQKGQRGIGTLPYMAPEQFVDFATADIRSDVYSFGIMLYEMLIGEWPFSGMFFEEWMVHHLRSNPSDPRKLRRDIPSALGAVTLRCLSKDSRDRYKSFSDLGRELEDIFYQEFREKLPVIVVGEIEAWELSNKGASLDNLGRFDEALECCDQVLAINPRDVETWCIKGNTLDNLGRLDEALESYNQALAINPRYDKAWCNKGVVLGRLGRFDEALECCDQALAINPRSVEAWCNKGAALAKLGRFDETLKSCDQALAINPRNAEAWCNKGAVLNALGRSDEALECCDQVLAINPRDVETWCIKGDTLDNLGRLDEALESYNQALAINPRYDKAWCNKGVVLGRLGRLDEALESYNQALAINPRYDKVWCNKGAALAKLGRFDETLKSCDQALAINPRNAEAWFIKGVVLGKLGRLDEALECYNQVLAINPRYGKAWCNKGAVLGELGPFDEALKCCDQALAINPRDAEAWCHKGNALANLGRSEEAQVCLQKAITLNPALGNIRRRVALQDIMRARNKHCEFCGELSPESHYVFVAEVDFVIFLRSPYVISHDPSKQSVTLSNGQTLQYDILSGDVAASLKNLYLPHIFCSSHCEDRFSTKPRIQFADSVSQKTPVFSCSNKKMPVFWPVILPPQAIRFNICSCEQCGRSFPNIHKEFMVERIIETRIIEGVYGQVVMPNGFNLGQSDVKEGRGQFFFYRLEEKSQEQTVKLNFCSDECAFLYAKQNNCALLYPNNVVQGFRVMITPYTVDANKGLGNAYKYRPQKVLPIT